MAEDEGALLRCLDVLRWSGLSFTRVQRSPKGTLVARDSVAHLLLNVAILAIFLASLFLLHSRSFEGAAKAYKSSGVVYPLYTQLMIVTIVAFSLCGNFYNRRFVDLVDIVRGATRIGGPRQGGLSTGRKRRGRKVLYGFLAYMGVSAVLNLWTDAHLVIRYDWTFRIVHYFCFYYLTLFTVHFELTMNYATEGFRRVNATFQRIGLPKGRLPVLASVVSEVPPSIERKIRFCMAAFMDLRGVEEVANEIFGKQIFLTLVLAFSSVCVNAYYFITLNLYGTSYGWLNLTMWIGFLESVMVAFMCTRAAESAVNEANRVSEVVLGSFLHFQHRQMHNRIKYFVLFTLHNPMKINAWIFYALSYESLLKVVLTSSAITALILQCDFLRGSLGVHTNSTASTPTDAWG